MTHSTATTNTGKEYALVVTTPRTVGEVAKAIKKHALPQFKTMKDQALVDALVESHHLKVPKGQKKAKVLLAKGQRIYVGQFIDAHHGQSTSWADALSGFVNRFTGTPTMDPNMETLAEIRDEFNPSTAQKAPVAAKEVVKVKPKPKVPAFQWPPHEAMAYLKTRTDLPTAHTVGSRDTSYGRLAYQLRAHFPGKSNYEVSQMLEAQLGEPVQGKAYNLKAFYQAASAQYPELKTAKDLPGAYTLGSQDTSFVHLSKTLKPYFPNHKREQVQTMLEQHFGKPVPKVKLDMTGFFERLTGTPPLKLNASLKKPLDQKTVKAYVEQGVQGLEYASLLKKVMPHQGFQESQWISNNRSSAKAQGLYQQMPHVAPMFGLALNASEDGRLDPAESTKAAAFQMNQLLIQNNGDLTLALQKFNGGNVNFTSDESVAYARDIQAMMASGEPGPKNPFWVAKMAAIKQAKAEQAAAKKSQPTAGDSKSQMLAHLPKSADTLKPVVVAKSKPERP